MVFNREVEELLLLHWIPGVCSTQIGKSRVCCGECSMLMVLSTLGNGVCSTLTCGFCSILSLFLAWSSNVLYSGLVRIFWIAWELLPSILDATEFTAFTFFDFNSMVVSANSQYSGSLQRKFFVFSFRFSLWMTGWTRAICTDKPDSKFVENLQWGHFIARPCSSGGVPLQYLLCVPTEQESSLL